MIKLETASGLARALLALEDHIPIENMTKDFVLRRSRWKDSIAVCGGLTYGTVKNAALALLEGLQPPVSYQVIHGLIKQRLEQTRWVPFRVLDLIAEFCYGSSVCRRENVDSLLDPICDASTAIATDDNIRDVDITRQTCFRFVMCAITRPCLGQASISGLGKTEPL